MGDEEEEEVVEEEPPEEEAPAEEGAEDATEEAPEGGGDGGDDEGGPSPFAVCCAGLFFFPLALYLLGQNEINYVCQQNKFIQFDAKATEATCTEVPESGTIAYFSCPLDKSTFQPWSSTVDFLNQGAMVDDNNTLPPPAEIEWEAPVASLTVQQAMCVKTVKQIKDKKGKVTGTKTTYAAKVVDARSWKRLDTKDCMSTKDKAKVKAACGDDACGGTKETSYSTERKYGTGIKAGAYVLSQAVLKQWASFIWSKEGQPSTNCKGGRPMGCVTITAMTDKSTGISGFVKFGADGAMEQLPVDATWGCDGESTMEISSLTGTKAERISALNESAGTWATIMRVVGLLMSILGVYCILYPIAVAADKLGDLLAFIPGVGECLEDFIEGVVGVILWIIAIAIGCCCSIFTIAIFWLYIRPLYGAGGLLVCFGCMGLVYMAQSSSGERKRKGKRAVNNIEMATPMTGAMQTYDIVVPPGASPGDPVPFVTPDGRQLTANVPDGYSEGQVFQVAG